MTSVGGPTSIPQPSPQNYGRKQSRQGKGSKIAHLSQNIKTPPPQGKTQHTAATLVKNPSPVEEKTSGLSETIILKKDVSDLSQKHKQYDREAEKFLAANNFKAAFEKRALAASLPIVDTEHPLYPLNTAMQSKSTFSVDWGPNTVDDPKATFGAHFHSLDSDALKGTSLNIKQRVIDGEKKDIIELQLTHHTRAALQKNIEAIQKNVDTFTDSLPLQMKNDGVKAIKVTTCGYNFPKRDPTTGNFSSKDGYEIKDSALEINFEGYGKVVIPTNKDYFTLYNDIKIELDSSLPDGEAAKRAQQMLSMLGCGPILSQQTEEDGLKVKIWVLFRTLYPGPAYKMERDPSLHNLTSDQLKDLIRQKVPEMKDHFETYLDNPKKMNLIDNLPEKKVWAVQDLANKMREKGAYGLMSGIGLKTQDFSVTAHTISCILKTGSLSSKERFKTGLIIKGASSDVDMKRGGGDQVFTRLINKETSQYEVNKFIISGAAQILFDLDSIHFGAYAYDKDLYGSKIGYDYPIRKNMIDFASTANRLNEVMIKNRIPPTYIRGVLVQSEENKKKLIEVFEEKGLVQDGKINGIAIADFIHVGNQFTPEMWKKAA